MPSPSPQIPEPGAADLRVDAARGLILSSIQPVAERETMSLQDALGRVLAADLISPLDVPAHDNSAMDGYAFRGAELAGQGATTLQIAATLLAGGAVPSAPGPGHCLRIMTGAVMPPGLDTVVPQELCSVQGDTLTIPAGVVRPGDNRRRRGEDLSVGQCALKAGRRLVPADLGLAASLGRTTLEVVRRLTVAVLSTGDELVAPGEPLRPGCIYDSNRHSLLAATQQLGLQTLDLGLVRDDPSALLAAVQSARAQADVLLVSGGASAGDADHTRQILDAEGELAFWKVAMRPGRPLAFGRLRGEGRPVWVFALPGNPVAALSAFYVFARDALLKLAGAVEPALPSLSVRSAATIRKRPGRAEFLRGVVSRAADGDWQVALTGPQGSGILRSMSEANALVLLDHDRGTVAAGERVEVWLMGGLN